MKHHIGTTLAAVLMLSIVSAQDTIEYLDGNNRTGRLAGADDKVFKLRIPAPVAGQQAAVISINRNEVEKIIFGPDPDLETVINDPVIGRTAFARLLWQRLEPFLSVPESPTAKAGLAYGDILLLSADANRHNEALDLFRRIETKAWNEQDRGRALRGRLQALLCLGRVDEASREVEEMAARTEDPELLLETKLLLAETRLAALRALLGANPRWSEDPPVQAERKRLLNETLDLALYPFLFHGTSREQAAKGLWLAREAHLLAGDTDTARDVATDIIVIYPQTRHAGPAREALQEKPPES